jgi:pimeloyl-ACP methyl ester carboxylesterase
LVGGGVPPPPPRGGGSPPAAPLVLIHRANDHAGTWFTVAPSLARTRRAIIPNLAGHGESDPRSGPIPISLLIANLEALLKDERDLTVVGNSFGGWMALLYTLRNRERVSRLVLESSGGLNRPLAVPLVARTRRGAITILQAVHGPDYGPQEWVIDALLARSTESPMLRLTELLEHAVESRLGEIGVPTTLIAGADDGVVTREYAEEVRDAIPNARMVVIDGAAHIPHLQQPARFLECLISIS